MTNYLKKQNSNVLAKLQKHKKLSYSGKQWLIEALDPFHDSVIRNTGLPDTETAKTIVIPINGEFTISAPPGITTGTWDVNIFNLPECSSGANAYGVNMSTGGDPSSKAPNPVPLGIINWISGPTGTTPLVYTANNPIMQNNCTWNSVNLPVNVVNCTSRIVSMGFEVRNTTAEINLQGEVFCYRTPQIMQPISGGYYTDSINAVAGQSSFNLSDTGFLSRLPPISLNSIELYPDTVTWEAKKGSYSVPTMNPEINYAKDPTSGSRLFTTYSEPNSSLGLQVVSATTFTLVSGSVTTQLHGGYQSKPMPFDTVGSFYTGLSLSTTLVLSYKIFVEYIPDVSNTTLVSLAKPSPTYDPFALQLYSYARAKMPPGVPVDENNIGEWFSKVIDWIGDNAEGIGSAVGTLVPEAALAGKITAIVAKQMRGMMNHANSSIKQVKNVVKQEVKRDVRQLKK